MSRLNEGFSRGHNLGRTFPLALMSDWNVLWMHEGDKLNEANIFKAFNGEVFRLGLHAAIIQQMRLIDASRLALGTNGLGEIRCIPLDLIKFIMDYAANLADVDIVATSAIGIACDHISRSTSV